MLGDAKLPVLNCEEARRDRSLQDALGGLHDGAPQCAVRKSAGNVAAASPCQDRSAGRPPLGEAFGDRIEDLQWIDQFVRNVRPYVRVRLEDGVLIKMPAEAHQLNGRGLQLLQRALQGEPICELAASMGAAGHPQRIRSIHEFFCDVRDLLAGRLGDGWGRAATRVTRFAGGFTRLPVLSEIAATYRCNLACTFCYAGCGTPDASPGNAARERHRDWWKPWRKTTRRRGERDPVAEEMTTAEILHVIDELVDVGKTPSLSFTGGECTLRADLPQLIAHARRRGMRVNIITNGVRADSRPYVETLVDAGLTSAQVSIEGPTAGIHDRLTQRPGAFSRTLRGICNLRDAGLHVHTNTTICGQNAEHLTAIIDLAKSLGLPHVSMNQLIPTGTPNLVRNRQIRISYSKVGRCLMRAKQHADRVGIGLHWYSPTPFCIFNPIAHGLGNKGCAACDGLIHISPAGEVLPCSSFAGGVGNILKEGLEKVWFGQDAQYFKRKRQARFVCRTCEHFSLCQGACTLYWSGMGCAELYRAYLRRRVESWAARLGLGGWLAERQASRDSRGRSPACCAGQDEG